VADAEARRDCGLASLSPTTISDADLEAELHRNAGTNRANRRQVDCRSVL
jgi:hypothetical protein